MRPRTPEAPGGRLLPLPALVPAVFLARPNRFVAECRLPGGDRVRAHVPATGRLAELLVPGAIVWLAPAPGTHRRLAWDLLLVRHGPRLVSVDTRLPVKLARRALEAGLVPGLPIAPLRGEVQRGASRLDFRLETAPPTWIEVKSVTLVVDGVARFPDAPTLRGTRHVEELTTAVQEGERGAVLFVVQRDDATRVEAHHQNDPAFSAALSRARHAGVLLAAIACRVTTTGIHLAGPVPVDA